MAYDEKLAGRVRDFFRRRKVNSAEKRMMGGLCFMVNGKMCVGVEKERLMLRIGPDAYEAALARTGCTPMDFTGRPMKGFVFVGGAGFSSQRDLESWLSLALNFNPQAKPSRSRSKPGTGTRKVSRRMS